MAVEFAGLEIEGPPSASTLTNARLAATSGVCAVPGRHRSITPIFLRNVKPDQLVPGSRRARCR